MTPQEQYEMIIEEGSQEIKSISGQLSLTMWNSMGIIYEVCEKAYKVLEKYDSAGPGRKKEGLKSMSRTYADLARNTGLAVGFIKRAHNVFKKTYEIVGDKATIPVLPIGPRVAEVIVSTSKIEDFEKTKLLQEAIKTCMSEEQAKAKIIEMSKDPWKGEEIYRTTFWSCKKSDPRFGDIYPGRLPGQIIFNLLYHYTKEGDFCLFPFVGSGTEADVATHMNRDFMCWDIQELERVKKRYPGRYFKASSLSPWTYRNTKDKDADFVFADPPRFIWGDGSWDDTQSNERYANLESTDIDSFVDGMEIVGRHAYRALKGGGKFAILLRQPGFLNIPNDDITLNLVARYQQLFDLHRRITVAFPMSMHKPTEPGDMVAGYMDLIIMEKR